jgi:hypothetical protein
LPLQPAHNHAHNYKITKKTENAWMLEGVPLANLGGKVYALAARAAAAARAQAREEGRDDEGAAAAATRAVRDVARAELSERGEFLFLVFFSGGASFVLLEMSRRPPC